MSLCVVDGCNQRTSMFEMCDEHERRRRESDLATAAAVKKLARTAPRCGICKRPMIMGQLGQHYTCCASVGGRDPLCNPVSKIVYDERDDGYRPCAICWRLGPFIGKRPKRRAAAKRSTKRAVA